MFKFNLTTLKTLLKNKTVETIHFHGLINHEAALLLKDFLRTNQTCKELHLSNCSIALDDLILLSTAIQQNSLLELLDLSNIHLSDAYSNDPKDRVNYDVPCNEKVEVILHNILNSSSIKTLKLNSMPLQAVDSPLIGKSLELNTSLTSLDLAGMCLNDGAMRAIGQGLTLNKTLLSLNLSCCEGGEDDEDWGLPVVEAVAHNQTLQYLNLNENGLSDKVKKKLISALKLNHTLKVLDLIDIKEEPTFALGDVPQLLAVNSSITSLNIKHHNTEQKLTKKHLQDNKDLSTHLSRDVIYRLLNTGFYQIKLSQNLPCLHTFSDNSLVVYKKAGQILFSAKYRSGEWVTHKLPDEVGTEYENLLEELHGTCNIDNLKFADRVWLEEKLINHGFYPQKHWWPFLHNIATLQEFCLMAVCRNLMQSSGGDAEKNFEAVMNLPDSILNPALEVLSITPKKNPDWLHLTLMSPPTKSHFTSEESLMPNRPMRTSHA